MGVALLNLIEKARHVAKQALGNKAGKPDLGGLSHEAHIVAHRIRSLLQSSKLVPEPSQICWFCCPDLANNTQI
jgi:hypothetical protein